MTRAHRHRTAPALLLAAVCAAFAPLQDPARQDPMEPDPVRQDPAGQEPQRPAPPPAEASPLPAVDEPFAAEVARRDLPGRLQPRDPAEGVWRLRDRVIGGNPVPSGSGYVAIGRSHLLAQFQAPGNRKDTPLLRAGAYRWERTDEFGGVQLTVLLGHYNDGSGDVHLEPEGSLQMRRFRLLDGVLRIHQGPADWLEFARVE